MMPVKLSARALGVLGAMVRDPYLTSAEKLSEAFLEGEKAMRRALAELELHGLIKRGRERFNGRITAYTKVTSKGEEYYFGSLPSAVFRRAVTGSTIQPPRLYGYYIHNSNTPVSLEKSVSLRSTEVQMPYDFFNPTSSPEDRVEDKTRWERQKAESKPKRILYSQRPAESWSCSDTVSHFADMMAQQWNIAPERIVRRVFIPALAAKRKVFNTDGEIERQMIEAYFSSISHERYTSAELVWKTFLKRFEQLEQLVRATVSTPAQEEAAQIAAEKTWDWMEE